jgi:hypothetical protein
MTARPVHDDSRSETGSAESVFWRKSRHSAAGAGAACVEATLALRMPDGELAVKTPDGSMVVIMPAPVRQHVETPVEQHVDEPPTESAAPWTRGSLDDESLESDDVVTQLENAHGLAGFGSEAHTETHEPESAGGVSAKGKGLIDPNSDEEVAQRAQTDALREYGESGSGLVDAAVELSEAHAQLEGARALVEGAGTSHSPEMQAAAETRLAQAQRGLAVAEARFDEASDKLEELGLAQPADEDELASMDSYEAVHEADLLLGRPRVTIGGDDDSVEMRADQQVVREYVAEQLRLGDEDDARELADVFGHDLFTKEGLSGGVLELRGADIAENFRGRSRLIEHEVRTEFGVERQRLRAVIADADANLHDLATRLTRARARYTVDTRDVDRNEAADYRAYSDQLRSVEADLHQLQSEWRRGRMHSHDYQRYESSINQRRATLDGQRLSADRLYSGQRAQLADLLRREEQNIDRSRAALDVTLATAQRDLDRLTRQEPVEVLQRQRAYLGHLVEDFKQNVKQEQQFPAPGVRHMGRGERDAFFNNLPRIEYKLKKLIVEPTGQRGYNEILGQNVGTHRDYGAKVHNVKVNNNTELALALRGWVEAKPARHQEKLLAQRIVADGHVSDLLDVVMHRINNKINSLMDAPDIIRELASGYSAIDRGRPLGSYIPNNRSNPPHLQHLRIKLLDEPDTVMAVLREPHRFDLREKIMVIHDLFEYFGEARHTPRTFGTGMLPRETQDEILSTTAVDSHGYRISSSTDRGQNPIGGGKTHPSTRNENAESTILARERKIPVWAGQSFTSVRMFKLAEWAGASNYEIGAVAYGVFAMWRLNFNHTTEFAYHTLHEVLDMAQNFDVPYTLNHQSASLAHVNLVSAIREAGSLAGVLNRGRAPRSETGMHIDVDAHRLQSMGRLLDADLNAVQAARSQSRRLPAIAQLLHDLESVKERFSLGGLGSTHHAARSPHSLGDGLPVREVDRPGGPRTETAVGDDPAFAEARQATDPVPREHTWIDPISTVADGQGGVLRGQLGVHSSFDARRFTVRGQNYTDITVKVRADGASLSHEDLAGMWDTAKDGVEQFFNESGAKLPSTQDLLHVSIELVGPGEAAHLTVGRAGTIEEMDRQTWFPGAAPVDFAHELGHQIGFLRDEYRGKAGSGIEHRPDIPGNLAGDYRRPLLESSIPEEWRDELSGPLMADQGLRGRHLQLLDRLVGDDVPLSHSLGSAAHGHDTTAPQPHIEVLDPAVAQDTALDVQPPRFGGAPVGVGWAHARLAQSWGLGFDSRVGTAYDALLTAGGGSIPVGDHVLQDPDALRQELGEHLGTAEPSAEDWSAAAEHLGASVLILHGDGTMSAHGQGPVLVLTESAPTDADAAQRWVGLPTSSEDPALSGLSAAQVHWAASADQRFVGPSGGFFDALAAAGRASDVPELDYPPQVLRDRLANWVDTGLTDENWHEVLGQAGIPAPDEAVTRQQFSENIRRGGGDESTQQLLPLVTGLHYGVGIQVVHPDGGARTHGAPDTEPSVTLVPTGSHGQDWFSAGEVRPPLTAGAGTRPADVAGGLGWADAHVPVTGAEDHVGPEPSDAQQEWAYDHGRQLVEIPAHPDAQFDAILRSAGGGFTVKGEYVSDPARLREVIADEVRPALAQDLGLALVVHTIYAAHTPSGEARIDSGDAQAEIIDAIRNPGSRPDLADELVPYFANRLGLGVRTVDPSGVVGRYGSGRPVYVTWTADQDGARHWTAAPSDASRYALGSALRAPNLSDPALFLLNHAIDVRKGALRDIGTNDFGDDPVISLLQGAQGHWLAHGPAPRSTVGEVLPDSWHPDNLQATVDHLVQTAHASIGGTGAVRDVALGAGLHAGMATELFDGLFPQGIGHEPGEAGDGRVGVAGLPADQWIATSAPEAAGLLPRGGAALVLGGDRAVVLVDTPYGPRVIEFGADRLGGPITGHVGIPTAEFEGGDGLALIVDGQGHPLSADHLSDTHGYEFDSAAGWSFGRFVPADHETGAPVGVSAHQADWAERHGAGFVPVEHGPNAVFDAAIKAAGGVLSAHGVDVTDAAQLRQVLAEHLRERTAAPNSLRDFPPVHAAFAFEGVDRVIEEFFDQDPRGANPEAVHLQLDEHINSGKAAAYVVEAMAEPGRWEHVTQSIALDVIADWAGRGVLSVDPHGQVRLHGDADAPRFAVGRLGGEDADRPGWVALTPEHLDAESFGDADVHTVSSLTPPVPHTETGPDSLYHAVLDASGGAIQIDRDTLVSTPEELKNQLTAFLLDRPDVLDAATRDSIERTTGIPADAGVGELIDALADPASHDGEMVARHLIGGYLGRKLDIVEPDGTQHSYGTGRPITIKSVADEHGESHWAALPLESRDLDLDLGREEDHGASTVEADRVEQAQWAASTHTLAEPDQVPVEDPWRSATFCVTMMIDGVEQKACVSVAVLTLDAALAAELGVAVR